MKLGKLPAREGAVKLKFRRYVDLSKFPTPPEELGHDTLVTVPWGVLANDSAGCCVFSGAAHETMLWRKEAGVDVSFDDKSVLSDYSALTGYDPSQTDDQGNNPTDQGTDMQQAAAYRKNVGILDANGARHQIGAYLAITKGDIQEHIMAAYLFGAVGIGIEFPQSAMDQFNEGEPWDVVDKTDIVGGHYIPFVSRRGGMFNCITWGKEQAMTDGFFQTYNDESIVYLTPEFLKNGKSLEGFDYGQLMSDLKDLNQV